MKLISKLGTPVNVELPPERKAERKALLDKYKAQGKTDGVVTTTSNTSIEMTFTDAASAEAFAAEAAALAQKYNDTVVFEYVDNG